MKLHFHRELDNLKKMMLSLGAAVEDAVRLAIRALEKGDIELCEKVISKDLNIDKKEVEVEEECLKILALHQPVAVDLRLISAMIKINNDLERVGDEAVNIAERGIVIAKRPHVEIPFDFNLLGKKAEAMLKNSLDSLVTLDTDMAHKVILADDEVDEMNQEVYDKTKAAILDEPAGVGFFINLLLVSRHLERIGDHATNIAEEVIYIVEGKIHRHTRHAT